MIKTLFVTIFLLTQAITPCTTLDCPTGNSIPVVSWLVNHIDGAVLKGKLTRDAGILNDLLALRGEEVHWNGYGSASPFGDFYYPRNGDWHGSYLLIEGGVHYQLWLWRSNKVLTDHALAFLFKDMQITDSAHPGQHHFCVASVAMSDLEAIEGMAGSG